MFVAYFTWLLKISCRGSGPVTRVSKSIWWQVPAEERGPACQLLRAFHAAIRFCGIDSADGSWQASRPVAGII